MKDRLKKAQEEYQEIKIPKELNHMVMKTIKKATKEKRSKRIKGLGISLAASLVIGLVGLGVGVNSSPAFANALEDIPVLKTLVSVVKFKAYELDEKYIQITVTQPKVEGLGKEALADEINEMIENRVQDHVMEMKIRAKEYYEAFTATGGDPKDYRPLMGEIGYEVYQHNEAVLSFMVYEFESLGSSYTVTSYYNIDLQQDTHITLEDLFGSDYEEEINASIRDQIRKALQEDEGAFFTGDMGFQGIAKDQKFYMNEDNQVVIVFDKYEIAPGYMGTIAFPIGK